LEHLSRVLPGSGDAVGDPGYREALDAARGPVSGGMPLEDAAGVYRRLRLSTYDCCQDLPFWAAD